MPKKFIRFAAALLVGGSLASPLYAQTSRGAATLPAAAQNFTPVEKAACGPHWGRYCRPFHHRVCRHGRCWCAPC